MIEETDIRRLARYFADECTDDERRATESWLAEDPARLPRGDHQRGDRQTGPVRGGAAGPEADRPSQPAAQPSHGVAPGLGLQEGVLAVDAHQSRL